MKKMFFCFLACLLLSNCGKKGPEPKQSYSECFESITFKYITIDDLSRYLSVPTKVLVGINLGIYPENEKLTELMQKINKDLLDDSKETIEKILSEKETINYTVTPKLGRIDKQQCFELESKQNEKFQSVLYDLTSSYVEDGVTQSVSQEFSLFRLHKILWAGTFGDKSSIVSNVERNLNSNVSMKKLYEKLNIRIDNYRKIILIQHHLFGHNNQAKKIKVMIPQFSVNVVEKNKVLILSHIKNDINENLVWFCGEIILVMFFSAIVLGILKIALAKQHENILNEFNNFVRKPSWWQFFSSAINVYGAHKEINKAEKAYKIKKRWINIGIPLFSLVITFFFFTRSNEKIELKLINNFNQVYYQYLEKQNVYVLDQLNVNSQILLK